MTSLREVKRWQTSVILEKINILSPFQSLLLEYVKIISNSLPQSFEYRGLCTMQIVIHWKSNFPHYDTVPVHVRCDGFFGGVECPRYRANNAKYVVFRIEFLYFACYSCIFRILLTSLADIQYCQVLKTCATCTKNKLTSKLFWIRINE